MVTVMADNQTPTHPASSVLPTRSPTAPAPEPHEAERPLTPQARRALEEAEQRRQHAADDARRTAQEFGGRGGPDPVRYGDWEKGGIAWDF